MTLKVQWRILYSNCETDSNIVTTGDGSAVFYINKYAGNILKERKNGWLLSIANDGEENWSFSFPNYNYLYFTGNIYRDEAYLYVMADSSQSYDSGFERGLYCFGLNGNYISSSMPDENTAIADGKNMIIGEACNEELKEKIEKKLNRTISKTAVQGSFVYCVLQAENGVEAACVWVQEKEEYGER